MQSSPLKGKNLTSIATIDNKYICPVEGCKTKTTTASALYRHIEDILAAQSITQNTNHVHHPEEEMLQWLDEKRVSLFKHY